MGCGASQNAAVAPDEPSAGNTAVAQYSPVKGPPTPQRGGPVLTLSKHLTEDEESRVASAHLRSITFEKANVNVAVRIRPLSAAEAAKGGEVSVEPMSPQSLTVMPLATGLSGGPAGGGGRTSDFAFDSVFPADATQNQVYRHGARAILTKVLEGYNGCIFAYGQTGSGKTHTMEGTREDPGVIPRLCEDVFSTIARQRADRTYCVTVSYLEVYNETLKDLLSDVKGSVAIGGAGASASGAGSDAGDSGVAKESGASRGPMIREDPSTGVFVENAACIAVSSYDQVEALLHSGTRRRAKGETRMNAVSSRSHAVLTMEVEQRDSSDFTGLTRMVAKLHLVDLAGSERQSTAGTRGERLREGALINQSLSALGNVINALTERNRAHIPYRDSKLTRLLQDSLGGNSRTLMLACVSPASVNREESLSTLRFAERAKKVKNKARVNVDPAASKIGELLEENRALAARIAELEAALAAATSTAGGTTSPAGAPAAPRSSMCSIL